MTKDLKEYELKFQGIAKSKGINRDDAIKNLELSKNIKTIGMIEVYSLTKEGIYGVVENFGVIISLIFSTIFVIKWIDLLNYMANLPIKELQVIGICVSISVIILTMKLPNMIGDIFYYRRN